MCLTIVFDLIIITSRFGLIQIRMWGQAVGTGLFRAYLQRVQATPCPAGDNYFG
jgi:hypothetical protein